MDRQNFNSNVCRHFIFVGAIVFCTGCKNQSTQVEVQKPDLVISSATSQQEHWPGSRAYQITARIANIGNADASQPFHMFSSVAYYDYIHREVSNGQMVNDPPKTIPPGGAIDVQFIVSPYDTVSMVFIVVNPDSRYNSKIPAANIDESDYDNNSYDMKLN